MFSTPRATSPSEFAVTGLAEKQGSTYRAGFLVAVESPILQRQLALTWPSPLVDLGLVHTVLVGIGLALDLQIA